MALRRTSFLLSIIAVSFATGVHAADLTLRLDAREVVRKRVHTDMTLAVAPGPLTLVFPKWIPGEHAPSGPLDSMVGLVIKANGQPLAWARDPLDIYGLKITVPRGVSELQISLDSGLATAGDGFSAAR